MLAYRFVRVIVADGPNQVVLAVEGCARDVLTEIRAAQLAQSQDGTDDDTSAGLWLPNAIPPGVEVTGNPQPCETWLSPRALAHVIAVHDTLQPRQDVVIA